MEPTLQPLLLAAEQRLQTAVREGDVGTLDALLDDDVVYVGPDGAMQDKQSDLELHRSGTLKVTSFDCLELTATTRSATGVTRLLALVAGSFGETPFEMKLRYTRTWFWSGTEWSVLAAHASAAQ